MKTLLPKLLLFIFAVALFASCQSLQQTSCPAYSHKTMKPMYKPTFYSDKARRSDSSLCLSLQERKKQRPPLHMVGRCFLYQMISVAPGALSRVVHFCVWLLQVYCTTASRSAVLCSSAYFFITCNPLLITRKSSSMPSTLSLTMVFCASALRR